MHSGEQPPIKEETRDSSMLNRLLGTAVDNTKFPLLLPPVRVPFFSRNIRLLYALNVFLFLIRERYSLGMITLRSFFIGAYNNRKLWKRMWKLCGEFR